MTHHTSTSFAAPCPAPQRLGLIKRLWALQALARQRRTLARLSPERLDDLGLTRDAAQTEAARPVWDAPTHWKA
jgi:uncharacterized protein YjiS (DUF1127 family)